MIRRTTPTAPQPAPPAPPPQVRQQPPAPPPQLRAGDPDYNAAVEEWLRQRRR